MSELCDENSNAEGSFLHQLCMPGHDSPWPLLTTSAAATSSADLPALPPGFILKVEA